MSYILETNDYFNTLFRGDKARLEEVMADILSDNPVFKPSKDDTYLWRNPKIYQVGTTWELRVLFLEGSAYDYLISITTDLDRLTFEKHYMNNGFRDHTVDVILTRKGYNRHFYSEKKLAGYYDGHDEDDMFFYYKETPDTNCDSSYNHHSGGWSESKYDFPWKQYWRGLAGQYKERPKRVTPEIPKFDTEKVYNGMTEEQKQSIMTDSELKRKTISADLDKKLKQRLWIGCLLWNGFTFREIIEITGASSATISWVNRYLNYGSGVINKVYEEN